jgi:hypothetical protein
VIGRVTAERQCAGAQRAGTMRVSVQCTVCGRWLAGLKTRDGWRVPTHWDRAAYAAAVEQRMARDRVLARRRKARRTQKKTEAA